MANLQNKESFGLAALIGLIAGEVLAFVKRGSRISASAKKSYGYV